VDGDFGCIGVVGGSIRAESRAAWTTRMASTSSIERDSLGSGAGVAACRGGRVDSPISVVDSDEDERASGSCFENNCLRRLHPRGRVGRLTGCCGVDACNMLFARAGDRKIPRIWSFGEDTSGT